MITYFALVMTGKRAMHSAHTVWRMHVKCLVAGLVILSPSMASAFDVEIEADAMISQNRPNMQGVIDPGLALLRARGWRCDSVSAVRPYLASDGYTIICNGFNYTYNFSHADGNWSVEVAK